MPTRTIYRVPHGSTVFSPLGYQYAISYSSSSFIATSSLRSATNSLKFQADNCWETGNIWQIDGDQVVKRSFTGEELNSITLTSPKSLSVVQSSVVIPNTPENFSSDDLGAWIIDNTDNKLYRYDQDLTLSSTVSGLTTPVIVVSDIDGGCFYADDGTLKIYKVSNAGVVEGNIDYSTISASLTSSSDITNMKVDSYGLLWIGTSSIIFGFTVTSGVFSSSFELHPLEDFSSYARYINDFDIDRGSTPNYIYAVGGCPDDTWIAKYDAYEGNFIAYNSLPLYFPMLIAVSQMPGSDEMYIVDETNEAFVPVDCVSSSSDSSSSSMSSSSSLGYSSSSSSWSSASSSSTGSSSSTSNDDYCAAIWAHWRMDDNSATSAVSDSSLNNRDATLRQNFTSISSSSATTSGKINEALEFNGTSSNAVYSGAALPSSNMILSAWIYPSSWGEGNRGRVLDDSKIVEGTRVAGNEWYMYSDNSTMRFSGNGGTDKVTGDSSAIVLNEWNFVGVWKSGSTCRLWKGNSGGSGWFSTEQTCGSSAGEDVHIGNRLDEDYTLSRSFDGKIDEVLVVSSSALESEAEQLFQNLYNSGSGTSSAATIICEGGLESSSSSSSSSG
tara:strand:- start:15902 stop:17737 length:1836 start_codon:yes stop_codon:yes gene_type:complete